MFAVLIKFQRIIFSRIIDLLSTDKTMGADQKPVYVRWRGKTRLSYRKGGNSQISRENTINVTARVAITQVKHFLICLLIGLF